MEQDHIATESDMSIVSRIEDTLDTDTELIIAHPMSHAPLLIACTHRRMIHEVRTGGEEHHGKVRCLACGATFDAPLFDFFFKD